MSAFWDKFKKEEGKKEADKKPVIKDDKKDEKKKEKISVKKKTKKPAKEKKVKVENYKEKAQLVNRVVINPVISEDAMNKEAQAKYVFVVGKGTSKKQIAQAIQAKYKVDVVKINVLNYKSKSHQFRNKVGKKKGFKKAVITVKTGQKVELFSE